MEVKVPLRDQRSRVIIIDISADVRADTHLDGVVLWWGSPGFEEIRDLDPESPDGPYAPGGVAFLRAQSLDASETFEAAAKRVLSARIETQEIEYARWDGTLAPCATITWTDGVADVTSSVVQWSPEVLLTIELSRDRRRETGFESVVAAQPDLLAVVRSAK